MQIARNWTGSFANCIRSCFPATIAADAEIAVKCIEESCQKMTWNMTPPAWAFQRKA